MVYGGGILYCKKYIPLSARSKGYSRLEIPVEVEATENVSRIENSM